MNKIVLGITTYNRINILKRSIESLRDSELPDNCVFRIFDDNSDEYGRKDLEELCPEAEYIHIQEKNMGADRNSWIMYKDFLEKNEGGDLLVNCDSDLIYKVNWLQEALKYIEETGGILSVFNTLNHESLEARGLLVEKKDIGCAGTIMSYSIVKKIISAFPEVYKGGFDYSWSNMLRKIGIRLWSTKNSLVQHIGITGFNSDINSFDYGMGFKVDSIKNGQVINDVVEEFSTRCRTKEERRFWYALFPFSSVQAADRIVLYGAGKVAGDYIRQLSVTQFCEVAAVIDKNRAGETFTGGIGIQSIDFLKNYDAYDKIVISVRNEDVAKSIKNDIQQFEPSVCSRIVFSGEDSIVRL